MNLIRSSAFPHVCRKCGRHAYIVYSDKSRSRNFYSKEAGLDIIKLDLEKKKLTSEEGCAVTEQIMSSSLPTERNILDSFAIEVFLSASRPTDQSVRNN